MTPKSLGHEADVDMKNAKQSVINLAVYAIAPTLAAIGLNKLAKEFAAVTTLTGLRRLAQIATFCEVPDDSPLGRGLSAVLWSADKLLTAGVRWAKWERQMAFQSPDGTDPRLQWGKEAMSRSIAISQAVRECVQKAREALCP